MALGSNTKKLIIRILLFLLWLLVGAAMFLGVERGPEKEERKKLDFINYTDNFKATHNISDEEMDEFLKKLKEAIDLGYDILRQNYTINWDFMNAFFFAGNVVTTIGKCIFIR